MIHRTALAALLLASATAAGAQATGGPPIAYVKEGGRSQEIYLVNPDGSSLTKLYTAPRKTTVRWIDLKPGGNEIAFTEGLTVKTLKFHDNGQPNGAAAAIPGTPCSNTQSPDYHPSGDGTFVFIAACGFGNFHIMTYKMDDPAPVSLFTVGSANRVRWSRTGEFLIYVEAVSATSSEMRLKRRRIESGVLGTVIGAAYDFGMISDLTTFDITRTGDRLVFGSPLALKVLDFATFGSTGQADPLWDCEGDDVHLSGYPAVDWFVIYESPPSRNGTYILTRPFSGTSCGGLPSALTGKGNWGSKDWRPNPLTP